MRISRRLWLTGGSATAVLAAPGAIGVPGGWRALAAGTGSGDGAAGAGGGTAPVETFEVNLADAQWRERLTPAQYAVLRNEATERPYASPLDNKHRAGMFACAGCGPDLFSSRTRLESGTGWPSFRAAPEQVTDRTFPIEFLDPGVEAHAFTFG